MIQKCTEKHQARKEHARDASMLPHHETKTTDESNIIRSTTFAIASTPIVSGIFRPYCTGLDIAAWEAMYCGTLLPWQKGYII